MQHKLISFTPTHLQPVREIAFPLFPTPFGFIHIPNICLLLSSLSAISFLFAFFVLFYFCCVFSSILFFECKFVYVLLRFHFCIITHSLSLSHTSTIMFIVDIPLFSAETNSIPFQNVNKYTHRRTLGRCILWCIYVNAIYT